MGEPGRRNRIIKLIILVPLITAAGICLVYLLFQGASGDRKTGSLGDDTNYPLPGKDTAGVESVNSTTLVENANAWNGRSITFSGEAIGERMIRGEMAWIHLNDDLYGQKNLEEGGAFSGYNSGQAVWLPADDARQIKFFGDYNRSGDIVTVTGIFNSACREHGGDMDLHADSVVIEKSGHLISREFNLINAVIAIILCLVAGGLFVIRRLSARK